MSVALIEFNGEQQSRSIVMFGEIISTLDRLRLTTGLPENAEQMLVRSYELRARAFFNIGSESEARESFRQLVRVRPSYVLNEEEVSPKLLTVLQLGEGEPRRLPRRLLASRGGRGQAERRVPEPDGLLSDGGSGRRVSDRDLARGLRHRGTGSGDHRDGDPGARSGADTHGGQLLLHHGACRRRGLDRRRAQDDDGRLAGRGYGRAGEPRGPRSRPCFRARRGGQSRPGIARGRAPKALLRAGADDAECGRAARLPGAAGADGPVAGHVDADVRSAGCSDLH